MTDVIITSTMVSKAIGITAGGAVCGVIVFVLIAEPRVVGRALEALSRRRRVDRGRRDRPDLVCRGHGGLSPGWMTPAPLDRGARPRRAAVPAGLIPTGWGQTVGRSSWTGSATPDVSFSDPKAWFGPYVLETLLGEGGMGQVWRALDSRSGRRVALKRMSADRAADPAARDRFRCEAERLAGIDAEHVIAVHETGEINGQLYLDMQLAVGVDLATLLYTHPEGLDPQQVALIVAQVAAALHAVHAAGFAHRDIKPANVVLDTSLTPSRCYLVDLGIAAPLPAARNAGADVDADVDASGFELAAWSTDGTPTYMAPERFAAAPGGVPGDVYALGVLSYELLTGHPPFSGRDVVAMCYQHCLRDPASPSSRRATLAPFDPVLARALAKDPAQRHSSPAALAADITTAAAATHPTAGRQAMLPNCCDFRGGLPGLGLL